MAAPVLAFPEKSPPLAVMAAARLAGVALEAKPDAKAAKDTPSTLKFASGDELVGVPSILRYVGRVAQSKDALYGSDPLSACQVDQWLDISQTLLPGAGFEAAAASVNDFLSLRTFLAGYSLSLADVACWAQLQLTLQWDKLRRTGNFGHLARWWAAWPAAGQLEKDEFVENIIADIGRLGLRYERITYTSDYFPQLKECGERLIRAGHLYADDTPVEQMREERMVGTESARRGRSVEENLRIWGEMFAATEEGLKNCMRIKLDMSAANKALRDPVAFRCNLTHHWRTGHEYKCYPTYDFACPFTDALEGVTHALRTSEYKDREAQFYMILKLQQGVWPGLPDVHIWDYARLSFVYTVLSKRKLTWFVNNGLVEGWTDPRMPTVQGMLRRGLQLEALREFILSQGASKNVTYQEWDKIWSINKRLIDPVCPRHTAVETDCKVAVRLINGPAETEFVEMPRHAKYPAAGTKRQMRSSTLWLDQADAQAVSDGEEVTLMGWGNCVFKAHTAYTAAGGKVSGIEAALYLEGDFKKTRLKLTWLAQSADCPKLKLQYFGYLVTKRRLEEEDNFEDWVNRSSMEVIEAVGDINMRSLQQGEVIQLERKGYFIVDRAFDPATPNDAMVLLNIPDGRAKAMPGMPAP
ncbi:hypothetical protein CHLNCDRAFT_137448 [Chlorella variabilis]|uniref:Glutamyl-tRNA synthetase n=1 Tax=Chlorella variabilis TaxID=554065 RepID=E1ZMG7_CHLVA|nr:hypothetical protein CHLNCDRAFT_137448 [Chlorella variabilis]EFN53000.1 hypothetical protein CHLNCDRAFT_137448 [Chlorella variabilis]|eukprot:XP_005845102.1 hypothetical protein CHLNCDRAFT_137448 [Chlorella variabilis]